MILPLKSRQNGDEYVVCPQAPLTPTELRDRMLSRSKVIEGSYAYGLIDDLHSGIFVRSLDLKADYESYFIREFTSFGEYLRRRLRFPSQLIETLSRLVTGSSGVYHFRPYHTFLADAYGLDFLTQLLEERP